MTLSLVDEISKIATVDLFERAPSGERKAGTFVGRPFHLEYDTAQILVADAWKSDAKGLPQGCFLLAFYENESAVSEALLLRVLRPAKLPTYQDVVASMTEYYKDNLKTTGEGNQLDTFTRYEFSFSGLECRVLGTFYKDAKDRLRFGADLENFYSAHNYTVYKPSGAVLELIVNFREGHMTGLPTDIRIGTVRYSSSIRFQQDPATAVPVYVAPSDFLGKRTALFGMTRTGKSNTVKKIIQASVVMSEKAPHDLTSPPKGDPADLLEPFTKDGIPKYPVGQIIFDINGEYANRNLQDAGTAIFEMFESLTTRYSTIVKSGFKVMKVNFYTSVVSGFELVRSFLTQNETGDYVGSFCSVDLEKPENYAENKSDAIRYDRKVAAYLASLYRAGFTAPETFRVKFEGNQQLNQLAGGVDPSHGVTLEQAANWFEAIWSAGGQTIFDAYKQQNGHDWADEDLKALIVFLTRRKTTTGSANISGYRKLNPIRDLHTDVLEGSFEEEIVKKLRAGQIVIVDLSQGDPHVQALYSDRICRQIFTDAMKRFIASQANNFMQMYFEEAHNLFPKRDDKDLSQIYNRIAKEGAKLSLGLIYATQEASSISSNILKNTQNWFIAHLNNDDETKEIKKYYDFGDFADALVRFSAETDKGFVRMKNYSNPFVVPVQVDRFPK